MRWGWAPLCWCSLGRGGRNVYWQSHLARSVVTRAATPNRTDRCALWYAVPVFSSQHFFLKLIIIFFLLVGGSSQHFNQESVGICWPESCIWTHLCPKSKDRSSVPEREGGQASRSQHVSLIADQPFLKKGHCNLTHSKITFYRISHFNFGQVAIKKGVFLVA